MKQQFLSISKTKHKFKNNNLHGYSHIGFAGKGLAGKGFVRTAICVLTLALFLSMTPLTAFADEFEDARQSRMNLPVQTNQVADWPQGPAIGAEGAILMEARTGAILYAKNIDERLYPASTTKIMTGLLAYERCKLDENVEFSYDACHDVARGDSNIGMDAGEIIPMNKALEGMMILSANEVANAIAEHVGKGDRQAFVNMMNDKAAQIGCTNTHFTNPNGLHDEQHYTTCRDLATIAKYYFGYDYLASLSREPSCEFVATDTQPDSFKLNTKNMLVKGKKYEYEYLVGSKTGYTSEARQTLVSAAKKDGLELICVIMKEESPYQFEDTVALFNYGFENFKKVSIADHQEQSNMLSTGFFSVGQDVFGSNKSILNIDPSAVVILPKNGDFAEVQYDLSANNSGSKGQVASIKYLYHGVPVGIAALNMSAENATLFDEFKRTKEMENPHTHSVTAEKASEEEAAKIAEENSAQEEGNNTGGTDESVESISSPTAGGNEVIEAVSEKEEAFEENKPVTNRNKNGIFINVKNALILLGTVVALTVLAIITKSVISQYQFSRKRKHAMKRHRSRKHNPDDYIE